jgi:serine O-acetyltransferase
MEAIRADFGGFMALDTVRAPSLRRKLDVLTQPGFLAVLIFRLAQLTFGVGLFPISRMLYLMNVVLFGADLSQRAIVGPGFTLPHPVGVGLGAGARIGRDVHIFKGVTLGTAGIGGPTDGFPTVGDGCRLLDGCKLLGPVVIGKGAIIGANCLVMRSVPSYAVVATAPARVVRREPPEGVVLDPAAEDE